MKRALVVAGALLLSVGAGIAQQDLVKQDQTVMKGNGKAMGAVLGPMVKGAGEAGAIGSCPAVVNAIIEGLWREYKIDHIDMPATAERVWIAIREAQKRHTL